MTGTTKPARIAAVITLYANGRIEGKAVHENYVVYQVDGFAEAFKAVLPPLNKRGGDAVYRIYGDDRPLYTSPSIGAGFPEIPCEINISGVKKMRISQSNKPLFIPKQQFLNLFGG